MNKGLNKAFNEEITGYKNTLLHYAKRCEWEMFKDNAGRLFDYVESIEMSETERRFLKTFKIIMVVLICVAVLVIKINLDSSEFLRIKKLVVLAVIGGGCFEIYFFLNFLMHMKYKTAFYRRRRDRFIRNIEEDFKDACLITR